MTGPYQQGPYQQGPYQHGPYPQGAPPGYGGWGHRPERYAPGAGLVVGLLGLVAVVLSLFALSWVEGDKTKFTDFSSAIRKAGSDHAPNTAVYVYGAWAGYVLLALAVLLAILALVPVPPSPGGNTFARVALAVVAGVAAVLHLWTMHTLSRGDTVLHVGAWLGLLGYLAVLAATVVGARRVPA